MLSLSFAFSSPSRSHVLFLPQVGEYVADNDPAGDGDPGDGGDQDGGVQEQHGEGRGPGGQRLLHIHHVSMTPHHQWSNMPSLSKLRHSSSLKAFT